MRNKLIRIISENSDVFLKDYESISGFKKLKSAFMSISDGLFFYSTVLVTLYLAGLWMNNPDYIPLKAIMSFLCILIISMPAVVIKFDKYSTIKKMTFFKGVKSAYKQRMMNNELSIESLKVLSNNLEKEEMKIIFNDHKKIHFNAVYFEELLSKNFLIKNKSKKEKNFYKLLDSLYEKE